MFKKPTSVLYILIICISITLATQSCGKNSNSANSNTRNRTPRVHGTPPSVEESQESHSTSPEPNDDAPFVVVSNSEFKKQIENFATLVKNDSINILKEQIKNNIINLNIKDDMNNNVFDFIITSYADDGNKVLELFDLIESSGFNISEVINAKDAFGDTLLHKAIMYKNQVIIKRLINNYKNIDLNAINQLKQTPLHKAVLDGSKDIVEELIKKEGIDLNLPNKLLSNFTALHLAVSREDEEIARILIANDKIKINAKDIYGQTPLDIAAVKGYKYIELLLINNGAERGFKTT